jgi:outer membrane usher protein
MSRFRCPSALLLLAALIGADVRAAASPVPLWLAVRPQRGEAPSQDHLLLRDDGGALWATREDLLAWGLLDPAGTALSHDDRSWYALDAQPGLRTRFDGSEQTLALDLDPQLRSVQLRDLGAERRLPQQDPIEPGGWIDADAQVEQEAGVTAFSALFDASVFNDRGFGRSNALLREQRLVRLDTSWSIEDAEALQRVDIGDSSVRAGAWGRALRFGGLSFGSDFSLQPDLVTFPQPSMSGLAELPSTLDVYVNGMLARRERVGAGPFVLSDVPVQSGANRTRVVVRDALGREQVLTQAFYAPAELLRAGLSDLRVDAGWLREDYGLRDFGYGSGFVAGSLRRGLRDTLTLEGRGEAGNGRLAGGVSSAMALPFGGVAELALAGSQGSAGRGGLLRLGMDWRGERGWSFGARMRQVTPSWTDLGERRALRRQQSSANLGLNLGHGWSTTLTGVQQSERARPDTRLLSLDLSTRIRSGWFVSANLLRTRQAAFEGARAATSDFVGVNLVGRFGRGTVVGESRRAAGRSGSAMEWQNDAGEALDDRYRLRLEQGESERWLTQGEWNVERGRLTATASHHAFGESLRVGGVSRLAWLRDDLFWTRDGAEGFVVVDTHGLEGVGVMQDQRLAARTDGRGLALMPGLRAYQPNRFDLVDADVPIDADVATLERTVVPAARGGLRVDFPMRTPGTRLRLQMPGGAPIPIEARVQDRLTGMRLPVGSGGEASWPHGEAPDELDVEVDGHWCSVHVPRDRVADAPLALDCGAAS